MSEPTRPGWLPAPQHELLLRAGLLPREAALESFDLWLERFGWQQIDDAGRRLVPLVHHNLTAAPVSRPERDVLKRAYREAWARAASLEKPVADVLQALAAGGIDTIVLKGASLTAAYHGDSALRPMGDLDLLVPPRDVMRALEVLSTRDYGPAPRLDEGFTFSAIETALHALTLRTRSEKRGAMEIDLHWHALLESRQVDSDESFWSGARTTTIAGVPVHVLCPADQVLHLCVHGAREDHVPTVRWIADVVLTLRLHASAMDWQRLEEEAGRRRLTATLRSALRYLRDEFDAPIPADFLERLEHKRLPLTERVEANVLGRRGAASTQWEMLAVRYQEHLRTGVPLAKRAGPATWISFLERRVGAERLKDMPARLLHVMKRRLGRTSRAEDRAALERRRGPLARLGATYRWSDVIDFRAGGDAPRFCIDGWSLPETSATWTDGEEAWLVLRPEAPATGDLELKMRFEPFCPSPHELAVDLAVNDTCLHSWTFRDGEGLAEHSVEIPAATAQSQDVLVIELRIHNPLAPTSIGMPRDHRRLGLYVRELSVHPTPGI